jgi:hypothetical protein
MTIYTTCFNLLCFTAKMDFKEYGLEVNVKKSRSYFVTKKCGTNCNINIANGSAENVEMLKYLERTLKKSELHSQRI